MNKAGVPDWQLLFIKMQLDSADALGQAKDFKLSQYKLGS